MKIETELTYERAIEIFRCDAESGVLERKLKSGRWKVCGDKPNKEGYGQVKVDGKVYRSHRLIWILVHGSWPEFIDHKDRDRMNNKISNLRSVTKSENEHNREINKNNSSGYTGVHFFKQANKWASRIYVNSKEIHLGYFDSPEEAHLARMLAKIEHHPTSPDTQEYLRELTLAG